MKKENIIDIITDEDGRKIVVITDIRFKGKRNIDWEDVENYLKEYVGKCYEVVETADQVFIGNDFPEELKGSEDTKRLCGANAKTKLKIFEEHGVAAKLAKQTGYATDLTEAKSVIANSNDISKRLHGICDYFRGMSILTEGYSSTHNKKRNWDGLYYLLQNHTVY